MDDLSTRLSLLVVIPFFTAILSWAQYGASLQGTVADRTGAVVPGASVTVINQETGVEHTTVSSGPGFYRSAGLNAGWYRIEVQAGSFKKNVTPNVVVPAEAVTGLNVTLQAGAARAAEALD